MVLNAQPCLFALFDEVVLLPDELLFEHLVDQVGNLLATLDRENVLTEMLQALVKHIERQRVEEFYLLLSVSYELYWQR